MNAFEKIIVLSKTFDDIIESSLVIVVTYGHRFYSYVVLLLLKPQYKRKKKPEPYEIAHFPKHNFMK